MAGADMGIGAGYAAGGAADALQQLFSQRLQQQQLLMQQQQQAAENDYRNRQLAQQEQLRQDALAETARNHTLEDADRKATQQTRAQDYALKLGDTIPAETFLPPDNPSVAPLQSLGLLKTQQARPEVITGPLLPGDTGAARPQGFLKTASANQQNTLADNARADAQAQQQQDYQNRMATAAETRANRAPQAQTITVQTVDANGNPVTKVVPKIAGSEFAKPESPQSEQQTARQKTGVAAIDRLDQDIDQADKMGLIGPAAGRLYQTLASVGSTGDPAKDQMIGQLKSDLTLAKLHVDSGIGGARAAASPLLLQRWEDLALKSSKDLMHGYTKSLRADMGGTAPAGASPAKVIRYDINGKPIQ